MRLLVLLLISAALCNGAHFRIRGTVSKSPASTTKIHEELKSSLAGFSRNVEILKSHTPDHWDAAHITELLVESDLSHEELHKNFENMDQFSPMHIEEVNPHQIELDTPFYHQPTSSCQNGGILAANNTCTCRPFFEGQYCEIPSCQSQGIPNGGSCSCPPLRNTLFCEPQICSPPLSYAIDRTQTSFIFVLNQKSSVAQSFRNFVQVLRNDSTYYKNFILVTYLNSAHGVYMDSQVFSTRAGLMQYLDGSVFLSNGVGAQPTNRAILQAQSFSPSMKAFSTIYVLTDAGDSDSSGTLEYSSQSSLIQNQLIQKLVAWSNHIVYFIPPPDATSTDSAFDIYHLVAQAALGDVVYVDIASENNFFTSYIQWNPQDTVFAAYMPSFGSASVDIGTAEGNLYMIVSVRPGTKYKLPNMSVERTEKSVLQPIASGQWSNLYYEADGFPKISADGGTQFTIRIGSKRLETVNIAYSEDPTVDVGSVWNSPDITTTGYISINGFRGTPTIEWTSTTDTSSPALATSTVSARDGTCTMNWQFTSTTKCTEGLYGQKAKINLPDNTPTVRVMPGLCLGIGKTAPAPYLCYNGGTPVNGNCICANGFTGTMCEEAACNPPIVTHTKTMGLIIESSASQAYISSSIVNGISAFVPPTYRISNYVLTSFVTLQNNGTFYESISTQKFSDPTAFQTSLQSSVNYKLCSAPYTDSLQALNQTIEQVDTKGVIFFFADLAPWNKTWPEKDEIIARLIHKEIQLFIVITPPYNNYDLCSSPSDYDIYTQIALSSGGFLINTCNKPPQNQPDTITQLFTTYGSIFFNSEVVAATLPTASSDKATLHFTGKPQLTYLVVNSDMIQNFSISLPGLTETPKPIADLQFFKVYDLQNIYSSGTYEISVASQDLTGTFAVQIVQQTILLASFGYRTPDWSYQSKFPAYGVPLVAYASLTLNINSPVGVNLIEANAVLSNSSQSSLVTCPGGSTATFTQPLMCGKNGDIVLTTISSDTFQRVIRSVCQLTPQAQACSGHGTYTTKCGCNAGYTGTYCETPICENGGSAINGLCVCPSGFEGELCQITANADNACPAYNILASTDPRIGPFRQVIFAIDSNVNNIFPIVLLNYIIPSFLSMQGPSVQYSLLSFDDDGVYPVVSTSNQDTFQSDFNNQIMNQAYNDGSNPLAMDAVTQALKLIVQSPATIFVFTTNSAAATLNANSLLQQTLGSQINIIFIPTTSPAVLPTDDNSQQLISMSKITGGRALAINAVTIQYFDTALNYFASQAKDLVMDYSAQDCYGGVATTFSLESSAKQLVLEATGQGVAINYAIQLNDANGADLFTGPLSTIISDDSSYVVSFDLSSTNYQNPLKLIINTTIGACHAQVRVAGSSLSLLAGFSLTANDDFVLPLPFSQNGATLNNYFAVGAVGLGSGSINSVDMYDVTNDATLIQSQPLTRRAQCFYNYISAQFALANTKSQKFVITGTDSSGVTFQRTIFYNVDTSPCKGTLDTDSGICTCDSNHQGEYCDQLVCQNGGTSNLGVCNCFAGFTGSYCENYDPLPISTTPSTTVTTSPNGRSTQGPDCLIRSYLVAFFIDTTYLGSPNSNMHTEQGIVTAVANSLNIDFQDDTFTLMTVGSNYQSDSTKTSTTINGIIEGYFDNSDGDGALDYNSTIDNFIADPISQFNSFQTPPTAVFFAGKQMDQNNLQAAVTKITAKNYRVLGIDTSTDGSILTTFQNVLSNSNSYQLRIDDPMYSDIAAWIHARICAWAPVALL